MNDELEIVVPLGALHARDAAARCVELLSREGVATKSLSVNESQVDRALRNTGMKFFEITDGARTVGYSPVKNHDLAFFSVERPHDAERWVRDLTSQSVLISARTFCAEYERWENAEDPLVFEAEGRAMPALPMKSNGLPPPLDQMVFDTSRNPGRRVLRNGFVEAIGHRMWLGPEFFRRVPESERAAIEAATFVRVATSPEEWLELVASAGPFRDHSSADLQQRLRALVFAVDDDGS